MFRARKLSIVKKSMQKTIRQIRADVDNNILTASKPELSHVLSRTTIELLNYWNNFCRTYFLSCMIHARTCNNIRIAVNAAHLGGNSHTLPLNLAVEELAVAENPGKHRRHPTIWDRRDEPKWYKNDHLMRISSRLVFSNHIHLQDVFSTGFNVFNDLVTFRNYFAHKNEQTKRRAMNRAPHYGISAILSPVEILCSNPLNRPQPLIYEWIDELGFSCEFMCD